MKQTAPAAGGNHGSKARLLGHPIDTMIIVFSLGLLATAVAFDIVGLAEGDAAWFRVSFWMIAAGIIAGCWQLSSAWQIGSRYLLVRARKESACGMAAGM